jgi:hypothetical protein
VPSSQSTAIFRYPSASLNHFGEWILECHALGSRSLKRRVAHRVARPGRDELAKELCNGQAYLNADGQDSDNKFIVPVVVNGKLYVGTPNSTAAVGLLP